MKTIFKTAVLNSAFLSIVSIYGCDSPLKPKPVEENLINGISTSMADLETGNTTENENSTTKDSDSSTKGEGEITEPTNPEENPNLVGETLVEKPNIDTPLDSFPENCSPEEIAILKMANYDKQVLFNYFENKPSDYFSKPLLEIIREVFNGKEIEYTDLLTGLEPFKEEGEFNTKKLYDGLLERNVLNEYIRLNSVADYLSKAIKPSKPVKPIIKNYLIAVAKRLHLKDIAHNNKAYKNTFYKKTKKEIEINFFLESVTDRLSLFSNISEEKEIEAAFTLSKDAMAYFSKRTVLLNLGTITLMDVNSFANNNYK